ncbi:vWA domain-containing protein [Nocardia sp. NBC_01388]|uniref:vWA domain-containing protein n=1 Tax=Nocardia sp. NBC_01388 TaxID=2903596 RepID=UPI00324EE8D6
MTDTGKTLIAVLLDRSGSMAAVRSDTEGGFDQFIRDQREKPCTAAVTLAQFDNEYELVYSDVPVADVAPLKLVPRGMTALYDGIGKLTTDIGAKLSATPEDERPGSVLVVVLTDGHENASSEWTHDAVQALIRQQQDQWKWTYLFLGATLDAVQTGVSMGIARANSMHYSTNSTRETFDVLSRAATNVRGAGAFTGFSDADRKAAAGGE